MSIDLELSLMSGNYSCPKRYILVTGVTGAGKSSFIAHAMGGSAHAPVIGRGLKSQTSKIEEFPLLEPVGRYEIVLVDMPGFNDTFVGSTAAFIQITKWFAEFNKAKKLLSGVIYLHNIRDNRVPGSTVQAINLLKAVCGESFAPNITLICNMWNTIDLDSDYYTDWEKELVETEKFWGPLVTNGAKTSRYHFHKDFSAKSKDEARSIITEIVGNEPTPTQYELEVFSLQKHPAETAACTSVIKYLVDVETTAVRNEREAEEMADSASNDFIRDEFLRQAESARSVQEQVRREWSILATLINGLGYILAGLADRAGYPLICDGILKTANAAAMYMDPSIHNTDAFP